MNTNLIKFHGTVGERIKTIRESKHYSQEKISRITGISQGQLSRIESGERAASLFVITAIARALRVNLSRLVK